MYTGKALNDFDRIVFFLDTFDSGLAQNYVGPRAGLLGESLYLGEDFTEFLAENSG